MFGQRLIEAKGRLNLGQFLPWIESEFGMHERTARRFMDVARLTAKSDIVSVLDPTALYALAAPSMMCRSRFTQMRSQERQ